MKRQLVHFIRIPFKPSIGCVRFRLTNDKLCYRPRINKSTHGCGLFNLGMVSVTKISTNQNLVLVMTSFPTAAGYISSGPLPTGAVEELELVDFVANLSLPDTK